MDTKRLILFVIFSFSLMLLWDSFQKQNVKVEQAVSIDESLPQPSTELAYKNDLPQTKSQFSLNSGDLISVNTDLLTLSINTAGGDIRELQFNKHKSENNNDKYTLMTEAGEPLFYVAQSGLLGDGLPSHKSSFVSDKKSYQMNTDKLVVPLTYETSDLSVKKTYEFTRGSYLIKTTFQIKNKSKKNSKSICILPTCS